MMLPNLAPIPELYVSYDSAQKLKVEAADLASWDLTPRQICDLELLMNGGFNPLKGFLSEDDYDGVVENMRLADGTLWPMPITLDVSEDFADAARAGPGHRAARPGRRDPRHHDGHRQLDARTRRARPRRSLAPMTAPTRRSTTCTTPPARSIWAARSPASSSPCTTISARRRDTPNELRAYFRKLGWRKIVAFQTRNPLHRAHQELTFRAAQGGAGQPADPPGRRHDQARRRRPLHPRALLRGGAGQIPGRDHHDEPAEPRHAHGRPARGGLARADPQATTAAPISSSAATMPAPARTRRARISTAPTTRRTCSASTRTRSASRWSTSSTWSTCRNAPSTSPRTRSRTGA